MSAGAEVFKYFQQRYGPNVAAGVVGNTTQESNNNPNAAGGGLIQGQGGRTSSGSLQQQLEGVDRELRGPERATLNALRGAKGPREAARIFSERFERPGIPMLGNRERYALEALKNYGGRGNPSKGGAVLSQAATGRSRGTPGVPGAEATGVGGPQLAAIISQLTGQQANPNSVQGLTAPKVEAGEGPKLPQQLGLGQPQQKPADLAALVSSIAGEGATPGIAGTEGHEQAHGGQPVKPSTQAEGQIGQILSEANHIADAKVPYLWGGGHGGKVLPGGKVTPLDCSGAVSAVLGINPKVSGEFESWGQAGKGRAVTIYANPTHVLMEVNGRFFGTSGTNPGGGAGWIKAGVISPDYLKNFTARHPPGL